MGNGRHQHKRHRAQQHTKDDARQARLIGIAKPFTKEPEPTRPTQQNREAKKEHSMGSTEKAKWTDKLMALFTGALTVVAVYQIIVTQGQLQVMRNDERAWLVFQIQHRPEQDVANFGYGVGDALRLPIQIVNTGKTPARDFKVKIYYDLTPADQEPPLAYVDETDNSHPYNLLTGGIAYPNDPIKQVVDRPTKGGVALMTSQEIADIDSEKVFVSIFGIVEYDDVFGVHHWSKFCKFFWPSREGDHESPKCAQFNSTDKD